jgi:transposase
MTDTMLLSEEEWMDLRAYRSLRAAGASWADIAREAGCDWRTAKKYLAEEVPGRRSTWQKKYLAVPPKVTSRPRTGRLIDPFVPTIDKWLETEPKLRASVIHERLVAKGFPGSYQRVKLYVAEAPERIAPSPPDLHRRFEVLPGSQAQVDWGDEGVLDTEAGPVHVYSFHMTLSYSRDPFSCFVTGQRATALLFGGERRIRWGAAAGRSARR